MEYRISQSKADDALWRHVAERSPQTTRWLKDSADRGNYHCFVATGPGDAFMGLCVIDVGPMRFGPLAQETVGFLEDVLVLPPYRRRGIGTALLCAALDFAWRQGCRHVRWTVGYEDEGLPFYRALGFVFIPEEDPGSESPERCYTVVAVNPQAAQTRSSGDATRNSREAGA